MNEKTVNIKVSRFDPAQDQKAYLQTFQVPVSEGMAVLQALDYIYENLDPSLAYYDHGVCAQGICKRCLVLINGEAQLMCQTMVTGDFQVEPLPKFKTIRDLVYDRGGSA